MQIIKINTDRYKTRHDLEKFLTREHLSKGDKVEIVSNGKDQFIFAAILIIVFIAISDVLATEKRRDFADEVLNKIFETSNLEGFEKQIEDEFGVNIEIQYQLSQDIEDREFWHSVAQNSFQKAYSDDEPDYSNANILEPNPKYKS